MIKFSEKSLLLVDENGEKSPFSANELQADLIRCFLESGDRENSCFAEDISLAVEYALSGAFPENELLPHAELTKIVADILENSGFNDTARYYRESRCQVLPFVALEASRIQGLICSLGIVPENLSASLALRTEQALKNAGLSEASENLIIEFVRFLYQKEQLEYHASQLLLPDESEVKAQTFFTELSVEARRLADYGAVKISDVRKLHPCIRIFVQLNKFAELTGLSIPATEMELMPKLYELSGLLDEYCNLFQKHYDGFKELPIYIDICDMESFLERFFEIKNPECPVELIREISGVIGENMKNEIFKITTK